jgi:hypothetical protein
VLPSGAKKIMADDPSRGADVQPPNKFIAGPSIDSVVAVVG